MMNRETLNRTPIWIQKHYSIIWFREFKIKVLALKYCDFNKNTAFVIYIKVFAKIMLKLQNLAKMFGEKVRLKKLLKLNN